MESLSIVMVAPPYFDLPPAGYGGIEAVVADLTDGLMAAGHKVTLVGAGRNGTLGELVPVWPGTLGDRLGDPAVEVEIALMTRRAVQKLIARRAVDVVHDHTFSGPLNGAIYADLGIPALTTVHGPAHEQNRRFYRALGTDVGLISISNQQRRLAPELNWVGTVYNGLRPNDWPYAERKQDYALFLGRYHPTKGAHLAIEAAHRAGLPLIMAGKKMEAVEKEYFEEVIEPMLGPDDVAMGVADAGQKRELLVNARCLLFPITWQEPFGMVMIESMVCGTPVVALRSGSVPEVVEHGVTGLICEDPEELPQALHDVTRIDPAACRRRVAELFSAKAMARGYAQVYQQAVESAGRLALV
ncbi:glycosyltransferase family 4 protein [Hamadaea sp.]|uniref:glycosyltransferase family 4 protein n=1 Tax=Hamadaea sp. TaxID=2024425 RepID=UPI0025C185CA|nr:glycosyltransferase family 4 protein [Hamadaea sp.]